jgi:alcohol dehydrogenase, propanol-preferring
MHAMLLQRPGAALELAEIDTPKPSSTQVLIKVSACGVCRTDLHIVDGDLRDGKYPIVPGHEIIGVVVETGNQVDAIAVGQRVGVPWLGYTCGQCKFCKNENENLCDHAQFTGYNLAGGYAQFALADARYCFSIPHHYSDAHAAPLLCAGLIGYRALKFCADAKAIGIYGFGAAAHIVIQIAKHQGRQVYAFTRPGDVIRQKFARELGADWAEGSDVHPPTSLEAAIIFAPVGALIPIALSHLEKKGIVVCAGIHMSAIPSFAYSLLWGERTIKSVANLTRRDGEEFLSLAPLVPVQTTVEAFPLHRANSVLAKLREGKIEGAAVLIP